MKKTLHTFLNIAFIIAVFIDVLAVFIFEQNSNLLFAQIFLIGSLIITLILCVPMIFRNS